MAKPQLVTKEPILKKPWITQDASLANTERKKPFDVDVVGLLISNKPPFRAIESSQFNKLVNYLLPGWLPAFIKKSNRKQELGWCLHRRPRRSNEVMRNARYDLCWRLDKYQQWANCLLFHSTNFVCFSSEVSEHRCWSSHVRISCRVDTWGYYRSWKYLWTFCCWKNER